MKTHETRVKSYFRGKNTRFFEEDASKISHPAQLKRFRDSFAMVSEVPSILRRLGQLELIMRGNLHSYLQ